MVLAWICWNPSGDRAEPARAGVQDVHRAVHGSSLAHREGRCACRRVKSGSGFSVLDESARWARGVGAKGDASVLTEFPDLKVCRVGSGHRVAIEGGGAFAVDVTERYEHEDGTVYVEGALVGEPESRWYVQENREDGFFQGQIEFEGAITVYEITRDEDAVVVMTRRRVDELECGEVDEVTGEKRMGLAPLPPGLVMESGGVSGGGSGGSSGSGVPVLNSYPEAEAVVYLDFDGQTVQGTSWGATITAAATGYSVSKITAIWQRVAADMEPFNLNVSTEEAVYLSAPASKRIRCIITPSNEWYGSSKAGGVAKLGSFTWSGDTPCWVFSDNLANGTKYVAEACSHEVGHTFGLGHDGKSGTTYYSGHGSGEVGWAPIMGSSYFKNMTQWSKGEYSGANNMQDDLAIITSASNGFGYRGDDHGDDQAAATVLVADPAGSCLASGVIERASDVDVVSLDCGSGELVVDVMPVRDHANLDIRIELKNASGVVVASSNPAFDLGATLSVQVAAGVYFLHIRSTGYGSANSGYTSYATLGAYEMSAALPVSVPSPYEQSVAHLPLAQRGVGDDPDGDGLSNLAEHALGGNPELAESQLKYLQLDAEGATGVEFLLDLPAEIPSDVSYTVQASCTLETSDWVDIASRQAGGSWTGSAQVSEEVGPGGKRRFRIVESETEHPGCRFVRVQFSLSSN